MRRQRPSVRAGCRAVAAFAVLQMAAACNYDFDFYGLSPPLDGGPPEGGAGASGLAAGAAGKAGSSGGGGADAGRADARAAGAAGTGAAGTGSGAGGGGAGDGGSGGTGDGRMDGSAGAGGAGGIGGTSGSGGAGAGAGGTGGSTLDASTGAGGTGGTGSGGTGSGGTGAGGAGTAGTGGTSTGGAGGTGTAGAGGGGTGMGGAGTGGTGTGGTGGVAGRGGADGGTTLPDGGGSRDVRADIAADKGSDPPFDCASVGGTIYESHCYYASTTAVTWEVGAKQACAAPAHLVTITSAGEHTFVTSILADQSRWIGLHRPAGSPQNPSAFAWITGEATTIARWYASNGEPDYDGECVRLGPSNNWGDNPCSAAFPVICERE